VEAGALGAEIVLSGKVTGARSRVEKFNRGYIKHNGEPAEEIVDHGVATAVMKLGTIGVQVKIIPPGAELPDDFHVREGVDVEEYVPEDAGVDELLAGDDTDDDAEVTDEDEPAADVEAAIEEEVAEDEEALEEETTEDDAEADSEEELETDDEAETAEEPVAETDAEAEAIEEELDADTEAEAEQLIEEMDEPEEDDQ
jgi:small subunit ribosomal protein S3